MGDARPSGTRRSGSPGRGTRIKRFTALTGGTGIRPVDADVVSYTIATFLAIAEHAVVAPAAERADAVDAAIFAVITGRR
jgi:hypothetical protein